jgi:enoyl-CoA hydratase/carnithine racemase
VLRIEDHGRVRLLTLSRPEALNAFHSPLWNAFADALTGAGDSPHVAVVVITGEGRAFTAGQDLAEMAALGGGFGVAADGGTDGTPAAPGAEGTGVAGHGFGRCMDALMAFDKPLLAAVNGLGVGFGLTVLAHCDLVLIADGARLKAPFVSLGVVPEAASSYLLPEVMGWQAAAHLFFTAGWLDAEEAVASGLAWRRCPPERLLADTLGVAADIAAHPIESLVSTKRLMKVARTPAVAAAREREDAEFRRLTGSPANRAAVAAFLEKRSENRLATPSVPVEQP